MTITMNINGYEYTGTPEAIAQLMGLIGQTSTRTHTPDVPTQTQAPVQARIYDHVSEGFDNFVVIADKKFILATIRDAYTLTDAKGKKSVIEAGTPLAFAYGHKDAWDAFKTRMRNAGATYVPEGKVWAFASAKAAKAFAEGEGAKAFTADELNAVRDKWTKKSERKAQKRVG